MPYIWQNAFWPNFTYDKEQVASSYSKYLYQKGIADGVFDILSDSSRLTMVAESLSSETVSSSSIEGVSLQYDSVLSSVLKQLNADLSFKANTSRNEVSVSRLIVDANKDHSPLTVERLFYWHKLLFDGVPKAVSPKHVGAFRTGPVYIIRQTHRDTEILYEGVPAQIVDQEIEKLLEYINSDTEPNALIRSAVASFWFVMIHPFTDGNGRISRAIADYILSLDCGSNFRPYSISSSVMKDKKGYYDSLKISQTDASMDITQWVLWYISTVCSSLSDAVETCRRKQRTSQIMKSLDPNLFNSRQLHMLFYLVEGSFYGKLNADKWMKMTKCQSATATRDLTDLTEKGLLIRLGEGRKGTSYLLNPRLEDVVETLH